MTQIPSQCDVDMQVAWRTASLCGSNGCVEVGRSGDRVLVRDSKDPEGGTLTFTRDEVRAFAAGLNAGEFDDLLE